MCGGLFGGGPYGLGGGEGGLGGDGGRDGGSNKILNALRAFLSADVVSNKDRMEYRTIVSSSSIAFDVLDEEELRLSK